jgi:hypothetical protein
VAYDRECLRARTCYSARFDDSFQVGNVPKGCFNQLFLDVEATPPASQLGQGGARDQNDIFNFEGCLEQVMLIVGSRGTVGRQDTSQDLGTLQGV